MIFCPQHAGTSAARRRAGAGPKTRSLAFPSPLESGTDFSIGVLKSRFGRAWVAASGRTA